MSKNCMGESVKKAAFAAVLVVSGAGVWAEGYGWAKPTQVDRLMNGYRLFDGVAAPRHSHIQFRPKYLAESGILGGEFRTVARVGARPRVIRAAALIVEYRNAYGHSRPRISGIVESFPATGRRLTAVVKPFAKAVPVEFQFQNRLLTVPGLVPVRLGLLAYVHGTLMRFRLPLHLLYR